MNFQVRKRVGILLMAVSLVFIVATAYNLLLHTDEGNHNEALPAEGDHSWTAEIEESGKKRSNVDPRDWTIWPEGFESGGSGLDQPHWPR